MNKLLTLQRGLSQPKPPAARNSILSAIVKAVGVAGLAFCSLSAAAQNLSDAPIRIVTPYAPGFGFDVTLSLVVPELSKWLGQVVRIEHHPVTPGQASVATVAMPATVSKPAPEELTLVFALWTAKRFDLAPGVRVSYEPVSAFVPVLRIDSASGAGSKAAPAQYAGFIAPAGTDPLLIAQLREVMFKVMEKDALKVWTEVTGARVTLIDRLDAQLLAAR